MFHTYVLAASGNKVDIDRASFLMDKEMLQEAIDTMKEEMATCPQEDISYTPMDLGVLLRTARRKVRQVL